jgi:putative peptide zinc metalloprotease protein
MTSLLTSHGPGQSDSEASGAQAQHDRRADAAGGWRLVAGSELIGQLEGSGLREPPYLIRRPDGQVVQLSRLLFVIAGALDGSDLATAAQRAGQALDLRITPDKLAYVIERKLAPLGVASPDGSAPPGLEPRDVLLAMRFRAGLMPAAIVRRLARWLRPLYWRPVVVIALALLAGTDGWLIVHGVGAGVREIIRVPTLMLALLGLTFGSLLWHELGHATACSYGGARPGRIGMGIYLIWPALYTDVTDSYRLGRSGRLRTDLGGIYFNGLFSLVAMGAFIATRYAPLLVLVAGQQLIMLDQFTPWIRLDGYYVVSDLIGVSDLFERIRPVLAGLRPGRRADRRVTDLKPWARWAVTGWVLTTIVALAAMLSMLVLRAPAYLSSGWASIVRQVGAAGHAVDHGAITGLAVGVIGTALLLLPVVAVLYVYVSLCWGAGSRLARHREDVTLAGRA